MMLKFVLKFADIGSRDIRHEIPLLFNNLKLHKTKTLIDENLYWNIIEKSLHGITSQEEQETKLISEIKKLPPDKIIGFRLRTDKLLFDTYNSEMWCAGYIMNGGCSDDAFQYFRCWVISRGKDTYYKSKTNPDELVNEIIEGAEYYDFESFWYVALEAFKHKTGKDLYDYVDDENFKTKEGAYPKFEFTWKENDPESMKKICPRLFNKFNS